MEIIVHGKPNSGSHKYNGSNNVLCQNIVDGFFASKETFNNHDVLIVDTRQWQGRWYSVYTYWRGKGISDTAERGSFFAITLLVPDTYFCVTSEVYNHIHRIFNNFVIGTYLDNKGNYIVRDFGDDAQFEELVSGIHTSFENLEERFDNNFIVPNNVDNSTQYNVVDCDSKAFIDTLRKVGRIIVSENVPTKDAIIGNMAKTQQQIATLQAKLQSSEQKCKELNDLIDRLNSQITSSSDSKSEEIRDLKASLSSLEQEKSKLESRILSMKMEQDKIVEQKKKVSEILELDDISYSKPCEIPSNRRKKNHTGFVNTIVGIATFLLVVGTFFRISEKNVIFENDGKDSLRTEIVKLEQLQEENKSLQNQVKNLTRQLNRSSYVEPQYDNSEIDIDCKLEVFQNNRPISDFGTLKKQTFILKVGMPQEGYEIYVSNANVQQNGNSYTITPMDGSKSVKVVYGSSQLQNTNSLNVIQIK